HSELADVGVERGLDRARLGLALHRDRPVVAEVSAVTQPAPLALAKPGHQLGDRMPLERADRLDADRRQPLCRPRTDARDDPRWAVGEARRRLLAAQDDEAPRLPGVG